LEREELAGVSQPKPFDIDRQLFMEAFEEVRRNKGAAGVDGVTVAAFEERLDDNLYKLWNRMSSGTYFPSPVLAVKIPKAGGGTRTLGVPSVADRIAQTVALLVLGPRVEPMFHPDSYAYRPGRSPLDAVAVARGRCWKKAWVVDLDIKSFFDVIPWDKLLSAVAANLEYPLRWVLLYVRRWLEVPVQHPGGSLASRDRGSPQGATISPLLANIFLHYVFDAWMARTFPAVQFERYSDNVVVHCASEPEARRVLAAVRERLAECGLDLNEDKTHVVYCKSDRWRGSYEHTEFTYLGYTFRPRPTKGRDGAVFVGFNPAVSDDAGKKMRREIRRWRLHRRTNQTLDDLAADINPVTRGWIDYYGRFNRSRLYPTFRRIDEYLVRWLIGKYKRFKRRPGRAWRFLRRLKRRVPELFAHWMMKPASATGIGR
jgi:group II intron reverse transcriptase/maturase